MERRKREEKKRSQGQGCQDDRSQITSSSAISEKHSDSSSKNTDGCVVPKQTEPSAGKTSILLVFSCSKMSLSFILVIWPKNRFYFPSWFLSPNATNTAMQFPKDNFWKFLQKLTEVKIKTLILRRSLLPDIFSLMDEDVLLIDLRSPDQNVQICFAQCSEQGTRSVESCSFPFWFYKGV